jgi:hypothetical protein
MQLDSCLIVIFIIIVISFNVSTFLGNLICEMFMSLKIHQSNVTKDKFKF